MSHQEKLAHGAMEGKGSYNLHGKLPAAGGALALPVLKKAIQCVSLNAGDQPIVVADYGAAQGKNSFGPMRVAVQDLRQRIGPHRAISVVHIDQPSNDFNSLFDVLDSDPDRYNLDEPNVFPSAIGRSFYESVLPPCSVHLGWSSYAAMWLSTLPALIPGHVLSSRSTGAVRDEFDRQARQDWRTFLSLRARELRPGGRLVVVLPSAKDDGSTGLEHVMDQANAVLAEMVSDGAISAEERTHMAIKNHLQRKQELLEPFAAKARFQGLELEHYELHELPDPAWTAYEHERDPEALAARQARFIRSVFLPSLASAIHRVRQGDVAALQVFADRLESGLKDRLARQPGPMHTLTQAVVLAKHEAITQ